MSTVTAEVPAEWIALAAEINARTEAARERIAAENYRRRVTLVRGNEHVVITVGPADSGTSYEISGASYQGAGRGNYRVGDVASRFRLTLEDARAYANGWAKSLIAKGYHLRGGR